MPTLLYLIYLRYKSEHSSFFQSSKSNQIVSLWYALSFRIAKESKHAIQLSDQVLWSWMLMKFHPKTDNWCFGRAIFSRSHLVVNYPHVIKSLSHISVIVCEHGRNFSRENTHKWSQEIKEADKCVLVSIKQFKVLFILCILVFWAQRKLATCRSDYINE